MTATAGGARRTARRAYWYGAATAPYYPPYGYYPPPYPYPSPPRPTRRLPMKRRAPSQSARGPRRRLTVFHIGFRSVIRERWRGAQQRK